MLWGVLLANGIVVAIKVARPNRDLIVTVTMTATVTVTVTLTLFPNPHPHPHPEPNQVVSVKLFNSAVIPKALANPNPNNNPNPNLNLTLTLTLTRRASARSVRRWSDRPPYPSP